MMQAIVLCGGKGTRLRSVIGETQKTMVEVGKTPFLVRVVNYLKAYKITNIIFATGYKSEEVRKFFGEKYYFGVEVNYSEEKEPLGTGGAIRNAMQLIKYNNVYVLNGDTLFEADLYKLRDNFFNLDACMSIACKEVDDKKRFGTIRLDRSGERTNGNKNDLVVASFDEKVDDNTETESKEDLYINGGIYLMSKELIESIDEGVNISLEKDLIPKWIAEGKLIGGVVSDASFVDIGTPESLDKYKKMEE